MARRYASYDPRLLVRAARLARLPGVTRARAADRFGLSLGILRRALKDYALEASPSGHDLVVHVLTDAGRKREGTLGDLRTIASYCDYVDKDGCTEAEARRRLDDLARDGVLELDGSRWRLRIEFP